MLLIQHALFAFFSSFMFSVFNVQPSSSGMACSYNPKVSSIYGTKWTVCVCVLTVFRAHIPSLVFAFPHTNQQAIELHFNNEANSQLFLFCYAQKFGNMVECSVMLGAKRVHALFSAFRPYIKIQMRTLSMNMHKLVVRYEANLNNNAASIASYYGCH